MCLCVFATWNVEWASPRSARFETVRAVIREQQADVFCVTEGQRAVLPDEGHVIESQADYGYPMKPHRRKVLLWSRHDWRNVDPIGHEDLPTGRFIAGTTVTPIGDCRVFGVCIPWADAHVRTGRKDRARWEDHIAYLHALRQILNAQAEDPTVVLGDFNQRVPRLRQPQRVFDELMRTFDGWQIATEGQEPGVDELVIDHVVLDNQLRGQGVCVWTRNDECGKSLSDHTGVTARVQLCPA